MMITLPNGWAISIPELLTVILTAVGIVWAAATAYRSIMARFDSIEERMTDMETRNTVADQETAKIKIEQGTQHTTIAVMAAQMTHIAVTLERVDRNVETLRVRTP